MFQVNREIRDLKRFKQILDVLLRQGFAYYVHHINDKKRFFELQKGKTAAVTEYPARIRESFEQLGGAFIKLGQMLALREDLIPKEYTDELKKLQDSVAPFPYAEARSLVEKELKQKITDVFSEFPKEPAAAASIGQVYFATLKDGTKVIVKVQRPGIREKFQSDIDIIRFIAEQLEEHFHPQLVKPTFIIDEFEEYSRRELDFVHEARNIDIFYNNFKGTNVKIPKVFWTLTTSRVLVMEEIEGTLLSTKLKKGDFDRKAVGKKIIEAIYKQIFVDGYFHADPHPGNIVVLDDGNIAFIDFGIVGYISQEVRDRLVDLFTAIVEKDTEGITECLIALGAAKGDVNKDRLSSDIAEYFASFYELPLKDIKLGEILKGVMLITRRNHIKAPSNLILLSKCIITTESVMMTLDPEFNPIDHAKPFIEDIMKRRLSPAAVLSDFKKKSIRLKNFIFKVPEFSEELIRGIDKGEAGIKMIHKDMNRLTVAMDQSSNRIALSLIITALIIASAFMVNLEQKHVFGMSIFSFAGFSISSILMFMLVVSIFSEKR